MRIAASVVLFGAALYSASLEPPSLLLVYLAAVTPQLWHTDILYRRLPNRLVLPGYAIAALAILGQWWASGSAPVTSVVSGLGYGGFLLVLCIAGGMGMGDVKLGGVLGLAAGLLGAGPALASPVIAFVAGGVVAAAQLLRGGSRTSIPFGPYLLAGFWLAVLLSRGASST